MGGMEGDMDAVGVMERLVLIIVFHWSPNSKHPRTHTHAHTQTHTRLIYIQLPAQRQTAPPVVCLGATVEV